MSGTVPWRPTATAETLRLRAAVLASIRAFFAERGLMEVETPALSAAGTTDVHIEPMTAQARHLGDGPLYLSTSPELAMKRLVAGGCGDVYQICRVFRDGELGRWHQPEFTLLEWYRVGWDEQALMGEVETLLTRVVGAHRALAPTVRMSYREAFVACLDVDPLRHAHRVRDRLEALGVDVPPRLADDALLDLAFGTAVAPRLNPDAITFVDGFPRQQAALARIRPTEPPVAARFEVFLGGVELANGFDELTDEAEQRTRFETDRRRRRAAGRRVPPVDEAFLAALAHGLPRCAGVAVGLDRLIAVAAGLESLGEAMSFAHAPKG